MKKVLFSAFTVIASSFFCANVCMANYEKNVTVSTVNVFAVNRSVNVYKIQGPVKVLTPISADYDSETNLITIKGQTYTVKANPNYGRSGNTKNYEFYAGGVYYFNL